MRTVYAERPAVVVLDLRVSGVSSIDAIRLLREDVPETAVVVVTMDDSAAAAGWALAAGAKGFVVKSDADLDLPEAVQRAARGDVYVSPCVEGLLGAS
jgi:DNA-binding NarL/FixJ family response regulator